MSSLNIPQALQLAVGYQQAGQYAQAEAIYRQILEVNPRHADSWHALGILAQATGSLDLAIEYIGRALVLQPQDAAAHYNLGVVLTAAGRFQEAADAYRRAVALKPDLAVGYNNLGSVLHDLGRLDEAIAAYHQALTIHPNYAEALNNLGLALDALGRRAEAAASFERAVQLEPKFAPAHYNMGLLLVAQGQLDEAAATFQRALALDPNYVDAMNNLATVYKDLGRLDEAIALYRTALALQPNHSQTWSNYLFLYIFAPRRMLRRFIASTSAGRGNLPPPPPSPSSLTAQPPFDNDRSPERRLRIGYVSPDLRGHVIGLNILPLLREHSHSLFEIFCYSDVTQHDEMTEVLKSHADVWRNIVGLSDQALADLVRQDRIDILIDLTLHLNGSRLGAFARKPAPIQVTFAGYPGTTGLDAIDYRLTDPYLDPRSPPPPPSSPSPPPPPPSSSAPGLFDAFYTEESIRLPDTFWCFDPRSPEPPVNPLPALGRSYVSFGCLNSLFKVNDAVIHLWAQVLTAIPHSHLHLFGNTPLQRRRFIELLGRDGITPDRIEFSTGRPRPEYLRLYHAIDLCLDTFPYNGHTTSLDSYWMGVPVITLVGNTAVGRAGLSQLTNLGLPELIAHTPEQFVQIATDLGKDLPRLAELRATLRQRMQASPLMDAPKFARAIESAYRTMWRRYCSKHAPSR